MGIRAHAPVAFWGQVLQVRSESPGGVKQFFRSVASKPTFQLLEMFRVRRITERHLMSPECSFGLTVHYFRACPPLGRAQHDHRPSGCSAECARSARGLLDL